MSLYELLRTVLISILFIVLFPLLVEYLVMQYHYALEPTTNIAVINIHGYIVDSSSYSKMLYSYFKNPSIKGIILKINCCKSAAGSSQLIFNDIVELKKEYPKPVITLVENFCLAGGYLIASASDYIIAPEDALVGCVGSFYLTDESKKILPLYGIMEGASALGDCRNMQETFFSDTYTHLVKSVATTRRLSLATTHNWAYNKIFTGRQASAIGLINETGSMSTVMRILKQKALIDGEIEWIDKEIPFCGNIAYVFLRYAYHFLMNKKLKSA